MSVQARQFAGRTPNRLTELSLTIRSLTASEVDPYLLVGVLLEGMVHVVSNRIPEDRRGDTVLATLLLLQQRMKQGLADQARTGCCAPLPGDEA